MKNKWFKPREPARKWINCSCGGKAKRINRRNFPHGRKSGGRSYSVYRCDICGKENPLSKREANK